MDLQDFSHLWPHLNTSSPVPPDLDFTFILDGKGGELSGETALRVHHHVIVSKSSFFATMQACGMADSLANEFRVEGFSFGPFLLFLKFLYLNRLDLPIAPSSHYHELFGMAQYFGVPTLTTWLLRTCPVESIPVVSEDIVFYNLADIPDEFKVLVSDNIYTIPQDCLRGLSLASAKYLLDLTQHSHCAPKHSCAFALAWSSTNEREMSEDGLRELVGSIKFESMWMCEFEECLLMAANDSVRDVLEREARHRVPIPRDYSSPVDKPKLVSNHKFGWSHAVTAHMGTIYATEYRRMLIHTFDPSIRLPLFSFGDSEGKLNGPAGVDISDAGSLYVSSSDSHCVRVYSPVTGQLLNTFGSKGTLLGELKEPRGVAIDRKRKLVHVCDYGNSRINVYRESGEVAFSYGQEGTPLAYPRGIAVDGDRGMVFVVDDRNSQVTVFDTSGKFVEVFGQGHLGSSAKFVALDGRSGHVLVADCKKNNIHVFAPNRQYVGTLTSKPLVDVRGISVGDDGAVYACGALGIIKWTLLMF